MKKSENEEQRKRLPPAWLPCLGVFALALVLRLTYLAEDSSSPFFDYFLLDAKHYANLGRGFADGSWPGSSPFFRAPLYPMFLGTLFSVFGESTLVVKVCQALLGSVSCVLVVSIALLSGLRLRVATLAGALCAACGPMIFFDGQPLSASLDVFLTLAGLSLLLAAKGRQGLFLWLLAGACLGIATLVRGSVLVWFPLVALLAAWQARYVLELKRSIPALALSYGLCVLPVAWHNARYNALPGEAHEVEGEASVEQGLRRLLRGEFNLLGSAGGINLYLGNHPNLEKANYIDAPDHFSVYNRLTAQAIADGVTTATGANRYFLLKTRTAIFKEPGQWLNLLGSKLLDLIGGEEIPRGTMLYAHRQSSAVLGATLWKAGLAFPMGLLLPLALVGAVSLRREWERHAGLWLVWLLHGVFVVLFFVTARYRLLWAPLCAIYASVGVYHLASLRGRQALWSVGGLALALVVCNFRVAPMSDQYGAFEHYNLANALHRDGKLQSAERHYAQLLAQEPTHASGYYNYGVLLIKQRRWSHAADSFRNTLRLAPRHGKAHAYLGEALLAQGQRAQAIEHFEAALQIRPDMSSVKNRLRSLRGGP